MVQIPRSSLTDLAITSVCQRPYVDSPDTARVP
jgi:hypothetical protein